MTALDKRKLIAKVHVAKKQCGLDDETYRDLLFAKTGKHSCADLTVAELDAVLAEFKRGGWKAAPPRAREDDWIEVSGLPNSAHLRKALALASELRRRGAVRSDSTKKWLRSFIKRRTGIDDLRWLDPISLNKIVESLKFWIRRIDEGKESSRLADATEYPAGSIGRNPAKREYVRYLVERCHRHCQADDSSAGPARHGHAAIFESIEREFETPTYFIAESRFAELVEYLQRCIEQTKLGRSNRARGIRNYVSPEEFEEPEAEAVQ